MRFARLSLALLAFIHRARSQQECECVFFWLCADGKDVSAEQGRLLDIRVQECPDLQTCCLPEGIRPEESTSTVPQVKDPVKDKPLQPPSVASGGGCGRARIPADLSTKVTGLDGIPETTFYGEAPWMVALLEKKRNFICGGTLITPSVVLTAAHCLTNVTHSDLSVRAGAYESTLVKQTQTIQASRISIHPKFNGGNLHNDIALIFLEREMQINAIVDVICTPEDGVDIIPSACIVTGWGRNATDGRYQSKLSKVTLPLKDRDYCINSLHASLLGNRFRLHEGFICAGGDDNRDSCKGDGGGPLICPTKNDPTKMVQMGVVSWGIGCGQGYPTVLTSLKYYLPWIRSQI